MHLNARRSVTEFGVQMLACSVLNYHETMADVSDERAGLTNLNIDLLCIFQAGQHRYDIILRIEINIILLTR